MRVLLNYRYSLENSHLTIQGRACFKKFQNLNTWPIHVYRCIIKSFLYFNGFFDKNVTATLGPGWQMLDSFGFWWTWVNEIRNLNSFLQGGLNRGVRFYPT